MAKTKGVWGIDIGQTALKALRCYVDDEGNVLADSYDFIEYPKALSLPDADEEALVTEAMDSFLSRNDVRGDMVAMTVPGQAGLSRFFKPPPVDARTLPDIVKYEVRQQIPFPIEDVIWDWQSMGGSEMDNVIVDAEVGLFAIKRDTVYTALQPFLKKEVEVELVQLSPLATQNVVCHEMLEDLPEGEEIDMDALPDALVILSMGTDATDLIITNGVRLWLRNIPIGGNHFTKELSRELKLTHAKAEHLKRNARQAEDPKTVFQAMRRVFNDLKKEIDRSLSYYAGMDKDANLDRIVLMGNAARLPGLRQFLNKQLDMDIAKITDFNRLQGPVTDERAFKENILSFAPAYGLCLQALDKARVDTNLLPVEFVNERIVRAKKPWVLASVSLLMLGMLFSYFFLNQQWWGVQENFSSEGVTWERAAQMVDQKSRNSQQLKDTDSKQETMLNRINKISAELSEASETQASWAELLSVIDQLLPRDPRMFDEDGTMKLVADPEKMPFEDREEIFIDHIETKYSDDLKPWLDSTLAAYQYQQGEITEIKSQKEKRSAVVEYELEGPGFIIEIDGHHFFNSTDKRRQSIHGLRFVMDRFLGELDGGKITLLNAEGVETEYKPSDAGLYYPTIIAEPGGNWYEDTIRNPNFGREGREKDAQGDGRGDRGSNSEDDESDSENANEEDEDNEFFKVPRYDFVIQMVFQPTSPAERDSNKKFRLEQEASEAADAPAATDAPAANNATPATTNAPPAANTKQPPASSPDGKAKEDESGKAKEAPKETPKGKGKEEGKAKEDSGKQSSTDETSEPESSAGEAKEDDGKQPPAGDSGKQ